MTVVDLVRILRRHWAVLTVGIIIGALAGAGYVYTRPTVYASSATGVVVAGDTLSVGNTQSGNSVTLQRSEMYAKLGGTSEVAQRRDKLLAKMGMKQAEQGSATVTADQSAGPFIDVSATAPTAKEAQALANTTLSAVISEALRLETFGKTHGKSGYSDAQLSKMTTMHVLAYSPAELPSAPLRPHVARNIGIGALAGLVLAALFILSRRAFDLKVRSQQDIEAVTGKSVLGIIPDAKELKLHREGAERLAGGPPAEAIRQLRTNLRFVDVDHPPRSIVITSPTPGDGKSTIAAQLARLISLSNEQVIIIDCDLRLPTQAKRFGVDGSVGLTQVLTGAVDVEEALVQTPLDGLRLLPAGGIPPNPSELLGSHMMQSLVRKLSTDHIIILDAPPLLAVTDSALLGQAADGVILVTRQGVTHKAQVEQSARLLAQAQATLFGSVINKAPAKAMGEAMYGKGYGYSGSRAYRKYSTYYGAKDSGGAAAAPRPKEPEAESAVGTGVPDSRRMARHRDSRRYRNS